ncbi:MAG TPA: sulfatase, partial [Thermoanaerobaculia bacterium]|nr:sulfatase [Thermoanaerobaculia bacterium]
MTWCEWRRGAAVVPTMAALAAGLGALWACAAEPAPPFSLAPALAAQCAAQPPIASVTVGDERRPAVVCPPAPWRWRGRLPAGASLHVGAQLRPAAGAPPAGAPVAGLEIEVAVERGERREVLGAWRGAEPERWLDLDLDLDRFSGREVELVVTPRILARESAEAAPPPAVPPAVAWAPVTLSYRRAAPDRPNILFILVDTLRADHLTPYGYGRDTSPRIAELLAARGLVVERAYAQAPWTLPSAVSYMTSRYPGELLGESQGSFGLSDAEPSLTERLAARGYETAGFLANPTLHAGNGFDRGFATFYTPPATTDSMLLHGDELNRRALPWLRAHARSDRPFFLYLHYLDPHDPYDNPEVVDGRSPFFPGYRGALSGRFMHGVYTGRIALQDPEQDRRHLEALYDTEIHYVDARIGELLGAIPEEVLAETLVLLTADHGEELQEHGGWKHGQTLYEEQIRVPLLVRWDGRVPPGSRLAGPVRLLDLAPTLLAAAGDTAPGPWQGTDLLAVWRGQASLPRLPVFAQHLASGPLRAAAIVDGRKLALFNRNLPLAPADELQAHLWRQDLERLERIELYDLTADPEELHNLARDAAPAADSAALATVVHRQLDRQLPGVRVMASGVPAGARLGGTIRFDRPPSRWVGYFLADGDRVALTGPALRFDLGGETLEKGFLVEGDFSAVEELVARVQGRPLAAGSLVVGDGRVYSGGRLSLRELGATGWPSAPAGPALRLWLAAPGALRREDVEDPETLERLRALGYI